jgi:hypothetical protein
VIALRPFGYSLLQTARHDPLVVRYPLISRSATGGDDEHCCEQPNKKNKQHLVAYGDVLPVASARDRIPGIDRMAAPRLWPGPLPVM